MIASIEEQLPPRALICTDDRCEREEIHPQHEICEKARDVRRRIRRLGWGRDPLEPVVNFAVADRHARTDFIDSLVLEQISRFIPKSMSMILTDLLNTYGSCEERRLYRSLKRLKEQRRIVHVDLSTLANGACLGVYVLPNSLLIDDPMTCFEQMNDYLDHKATT